MTHQALASVDASFHVPPGLDVTSAGDHQVVHLGATPIASYPVSDVSTRRHVIVQLAEAGGLKAIEIAAAFDVTPIYVSQLRGRYRQHGAAGLQAGRRGPHGPMKVTPVMETRVRRLRDKGFTYKAIAQRISSPGTEISYETVRRIITTPRSTQDSLPGIEERPPEESVPPSIAVDEDRTEDLPHGDTRYAGAMLLHVALGQLGLWSVFDTLGARLDRSRLAVAQLVGLIALGFALRLRSIEGFKTALRRDFGMLLGLPTIPSVQTVRTQLARVTESVEPDVVMKTLLAGFVELEPVWEGAYYVDGHFCTYSGKHPLGKSWNARRRLVEPGQTDVYVHDATGRALFFINRPLNDHLSKVLPKIVEEIRSVATGRKILLIFDRGGYSGPLFRQLSQDNIGFITYLKGRKAKRRFPSGRFGRRWWAEVDPAGMKKTKRYVYNIYEKGTRVPGAGTLRTVVLKDDEGQIPVLTNCKEMAAAKVVHLLKMRWRQENSVKYLSEHYGVEQLIQYGADYYEDERWVDNPKRLQLRRQVDQLQMEIVFLEAELGQALDSTNAKEHKTARGFTQAHSGVRRAIDALYTRLSRLENRLAHTPTTVPLSQLKVRPLRAIQKTDRRNLVNAIKIATYNAERLLARRFFRHYQDPRDWLTIFRSFLQLPGCITYQDGHVAVELRAPDRPHIRQALEAMLEEVNQMNGRMFGTGPKLSFSLKS